ncbi:MAG TPA: hypothetical protein VK915_08435 [Gaiellaceae bacterium]|nr:hypothetical protein [Gaiellaceae bacterium]
MRRLGAAIAGLAAAAAVSAGTAGADGLPVGAIEIGPSGVTAPGWPMRYVALRAGPRTLVASVEKDGGRVVGTWVLDGRFTVPAVALDGSPGGLSADGRTLVLIRPRAAFPRRQTSFALLDTPTASVRDVFALRGDFSFDAISPNGSLLYLVQYVDPEDPSRYVVRGYDVRSGRLLPEPVVDPKVFGDVMRGYPLTRETSPDGRWAYTLYDGGGTEPFVHALDTATRTAACIVLDALAGRADLTEIRLSYAAGEGELRAAAPGGETLAAIDTETLQVLEPAAAEPEPDTEPAAGSDTAGPPAEKGSGSPGPPLVLSAFLAGAVLAGLAAIVRVTLRRRGLAATR